MAERAGRVEVFAPARADLAGGTLDLWPLYCFHRPASTINVPLLSGVRLRAAAGAAPPGRILHRVAGKAPVELGPADRAENLVAAIAFELAPAGGIAFDVLEQPPVGSGLGGSSVLAVALARACLALAGRRVPARDVVWLLRDLEAMVLGVPTGVQDYYPALLGGPLAIELRPGGERVVRLRVDHAWLQARLLVLFTGITHRSGMVNWDVYRARVDGDAAVAARLQRIVVAADACRAGLVAADEDGVGEAIRAEWQARRELAPAVAPVEVDRIIAAGLHEGALAGKACGAGGGGSVLFWLPPERRDVILRAALAASPAGACEISGASAGRGASVRRLP